MTSESAPTADFPWGRHSLELGSEHTVDVGPLRFFFRGASNEMQVAWTRDSGEEVRGQEHSSDWQRWAVADTPEAAALRPAFPALPLVVAPETPFHLTPRASARIYVRIPAVAVFELDDGLETPLLDVPTQLMSNTWFGTPIDGELCLWLPTAAKRELSIEPLQPHLVTCPVQIENRSEEPLEVEKIAVRVEHLSIFTTGSALWADETRATYLADDEGSSLDMSGVAPREAHDAVLFTPARVPMTRGFRARTFARLKSLSRF